MKLLILHHVLASGRVLEKGDVVSGLNKDDEQTLLAQQSATADEKEIAAAEKAAADAKKQASKSDKG
jgi:hypothetical protein